jgi:hypothetical protein
MLISMTPLFEKKRGNFRANMSADRQICQTQDFIPALFFLSQTGSNVIVYKLRIPSRNLAKKYRNIITAGLIRRFHPHNHAFAMDGFRNTFIIPLGRQKKLNLKLRHEMKTFINAAINP